MAQGKGSLAKRSSVKTKHLRAHAPGMGTRPGSTKGAGAERGQSVAASLARNIVGAGDCFATRRGIYGAVCRCAVGYLRRAPCERFLPKRARRRDEGVHGHSITKLPELEFAVSTEPHDRRFIYVSHLYDRVYFEKP